MRKAYGVRVSGVSELKIYAKYANLYAKPFEQNIKNVTKWEHHDFEKAPFRNEGCFFMEAKICFFHDAKFAEWDFVKSF